MRGKGDIQKSRNFRHKVNYRIGYFPTSLLIFTAYQLKWWWSMILCPVKPPSDGRNITEILPKSSCHTHLKHSKPYIFILQKVKKRSYGSLNRLFFYSAITLTFGGSFMHRGYRLLKVKLNWLRVQTNDFERQKIIINRENTNLSKPSWRTRNNPPKGHTKNRPFVLCTMSKDVICDILSSRVKSS